MIGVLYEKLPQPQSDVVHPATSISLTCKCNTTSYSFKNPAVQHRTNSYLLQYLANMSSTVVHVGRPSRLHSLFATNSFLKVKNIAHNTSEKEVRDFFSFWSDSRILDGKAHLTSSSGKITSLSVTPASEASDSPQSATVTFEKET